MGSTVQGRVQLDERRESGDKVRRAKRANRAKRQGGKREGERGGRPKREGEWAAGGAARRLIVGSKGIPGRSEPLDRDVGRMPDMDRTAAVEVMRLLSDAANGVRDALVIARDAMSTEEAEEFRKGAGDVVGTIAIDLMSLVIRHHPDLDPAGRVSEQEVEDARRALGLE